MSVSIPTLIQDLRIRLDEPEAEFFKEPDIRRSLNYGKNKVFYFLYDATEETFLETITVPIVAGTSEYDLSTIPVASGANPNSNIIQVSSFYGDGATAFNSNSDGVVFIRDYRPRLAIPGSNNPSRLNIGCDYYLPEPTKFIFQNAPVTSTTMTLYVKKERPNVSKSTGTIDLPAKAHDSIVNYAEAFLRQKDESEQTFPFITEDLLQARDQLVNSQGNIQRIASSLEVSNSGDF